MRKPRIWQIVIRIQLLLRRHIKRNIYINISSAAWFGNSPWILYISLKLNLIEVFYKSPFALDALIKGVQQNYVIRFLGRLLAKICNLLKALSVIRKILFFSRQTIFLFLVIFISQVISNFHNRLLPHSINQKISFAVQQDRRHEFILPVIIVRKTP